MYGWVAVLYGRVTEVYGWDLGDTPTRQNESPSARVSYRSVQVGYGKYGRVQVETTGKYCVLQVEAIGKYGGLQLEATWGYSVGSLNIPPGTHLLAYVNPSSCPPTDEDTLLIFNPNHI